MELTLKKAKSIIKEAQKPDEDGDKIYEGDMPDSNEDIIDDAQVIIEQAQLARDNDYDDPRVDQIMMLAEVDGGTASDPNNDDEDEEDDDEEGDEFDGMDRRELKRYIKKNGLEVVVKKSWSDDDIRDAIRAEEDVEEEDEEEENDDEGIDIDSLTADDIEEMDIETLENLIEAADLNVRVTKRSKLATVRQNVIDSLGLDEEDDADDDEGDETDDSRPWPSYDSDDEDEIKTVLSQMNVDELEITKAYEEENEDRDEIIDELDRLISQKSEKGIDKDLVRSDLDDMDIEDLRSLIKENSLGIRIRENSDLDKARDRVAKALELDEPAADAPQNDDADDPEPEDSADEPEDDDEEEEAEELPEPWRGYAKKNQTQILKVLDTKDNDVLGDVFAYESANKARSGVLKALEKLAEERGLEGQAPEPDEPEDDAPEPEEKPKAKTRKSKKSSSNTDDYDEITERVQAKAREENLVEPKRPPGDDPVEMAFDLTKESDEEIRRMHSAFTAYYARAAYVAKLEGLLAEACKDVADRAANEIIKDTDKVDPETKKEKTATALKAEAESDETVALWRKRQSEHSQLSKSMSKDADIYDRNLISLSREWTMRHEEYEHSGGLSSGRSKPRSKGAKRS